MHDKQLIRRACT